MSKVSKTVLLLVTGVVAVFFLLSISVNLYLQSQGVQQRISQAISDAIGTCVTIQRTSYVPWRGIVLGKITVSNLKGQNLPVLLTIEEVRLHISWLRFLVQRKLAISSIRLESPIVTLGESGTPPEVFSGGGTPIHPPPDSSKQLSAVRRNPILPRAVIPAASPIGNTTSKPSLAAAGKPLPPDSFPPDLPRIIVADGKFRLITKDGRITVSAEGITSQLDATPDGRLAGPLNCAQVDWYGLLFFKDLRASLSCSPHTLEANSVSGSLADGKVQGKFWCHFKKEPNFRLEANGENISLETLLKQAGYRTAGSSGFLRGNMYLAQEAEKPQGHGAVELLQGQLEPTEFLRQLGRILRIQELEMLHLKKAISSFGIARDRLVFENIFLESENLILKGNGPVQFNGKLDIDAQLLFNDRLYAQYQSLFRKNLSASSMKGYHEVAFHVTGHTSSPHSDLLEKLTGIQIRGNVGGFLQQLLGWPRSKD